MDADNAMSAPGDDVARRAFSEIRIDAGEHELVAYDYGGSGHDVLLVHATGFHGRMWGRVIDFLPESLHCVAIDVRAHGQSTVDTNDLLVWSGFAHDVAVVVERLEMKHPWGVGHSAGGAALVLAHLDHLARFEALWLYEPVMFPASAVSGQPNPLAIGARRRRATFPSLAAARENFAGKPPMNAFDPLVLDDYIAGGLAELPDGTAVLRCEPAREAQTFENGPTNGAFERLSQLDVPVAIVRGANDDGMWHKVTDLQLDAIPGATLVELSGSGHFGPMEQPRALAQLIQAGLPVEKPLQNGS